MAPYGLRTEYLLCVCARSTRTTHKCAGVAVVVQAGHSSTGVGKAAVQAQARHRAGALQGVEAGVQAGRQWSKARGAWSEGPASTPAAMPALVRLGVYFAALPAR